MTQFEAQDLAQAVVDRMADCKEPRFKEIMTSLVKHAHAFVQDVQLTPDEWMAAIQFLTATGKMCDEKRQEFIMLSNTLGISMLVHQTHVLSRAGRWSRRRYAAPHGTPHKPPGPHAHDAQRPATSARSPTCLCPTALISIPTRSLACATA